MVTDETIKVVLWRMQVGKQVIEMRFKLEDGVAMLGSREGEVLLQHRYVSNFVSAVSLQ